MITETTAKLSEKHRAIRRRLYQRPELSGEERDTGKFIADFLEDLGMNVRRNVGGNGVVGILEGGLPGRVVGWRADIDALPIQDTINREYKSAVENVKHACGHDVHTAVALGTAEVLSKVGRHKAYPGTIKFLFQPSEEKGNGAGAMIKEGALDKPTPEYMFGLHVTPHHCGTLMIKPGLVMPGVQHFTLRFHGDDISSDLVSNIMKVLWNLAHEVGTYQWLTMNNYQNTAQHPEEIDPDRFAKLQILSRILSKDSLSEKNELTIKGIIAATTRDNFAYLKSRLLQTCRATSEQEHLACNIDMGTFVPPVENNRDIAGKSALALENVPGVTVSSCHENVFFPFFADDYSCFQEKIPGVYFGLGYLNKEKGIVAQLHTANFDVDEQCIAVGIRAASNILISFAEKYCAV